MKKMLSILVSLMVLIHICSGTALAAETGSTNITVDYTIGETLLQVDISDIPVVNARQMLSILLVHKDADADNMSTNDVVYSNTIYLNGRDNVAFDIDIDGIELEDYRMVIRDSSHSHTSVNYSHLFETESGGSGTGGDGTGGDGTGGAGTGGSGTGGSGTGGSGTGGDGTGGSGTDGTEPGESGTGETKPSGSATEEIKGNAGEKDTNKPTTGDDSKVALLFGMVLISGIVVVAVYNRRHEREVSKNED